MSINVTIATLSVEDAERWLKERKTLVSSLPSAHTFELERDWDGLNALLTGKVHGRRGPLVFIMAGGEDVNRGGNQRLFRPAAVRRPHAALSALPMKVCRQRYRSGLLDHPDLYPGTWASGSPADEEVLFYVIKELKSMIRQASKRGDCLLYWDDA